MPELKPLPCPACKNADTIMHCANIAGKMMWFVECADNACSHHGRACFSEAEAIAAWNALPRALTWTHEPPKVAGWYWRKETAADRAHVFHFTGNWEDYGEHWDSDRVCQLPLNLNGNLWAGPIPAPLD